MERFKKVLTYYLQGVGYMLTGQFAKAADHAKKNPWR